MAATTRTPEEIRRSIEANRAELGIAVERLRAEVTEVTDWRKQINKHRKQVLIGALAGFLAMRFIKKGSPPTPKLAIEEAQLIKGTLTASQPAQPAGAVAARQAPTPAPRESGR